MVRKHGMCQVPAAAAAADAGAGTQPLYLTQLRGSGAAPEGKRRSEVPRGLDI